MYTATTATNKIIRMDKRIRLCAGSMRASKTISILLYLIARAQSDKEPTITSVVSESFPHLRRGAMRDFQDIMTKHRYWNPELWNVQNSTYTFETGSKLEFFSADQPGKVRGPSRDRLFVNEVNNINQESWEQLLFRTREFAFADWNPVTDFYMYEDYGLGDEPGPSTTDDRVDFMILTYKDNEALEAAIVEDIERKAALNPNWGRVYAQGKRGDMASKIFTDWKIIDQVPHEASLEVRGLDFGYARDPNALCDIYYHNGGYIIDELVYRVGMKDRQLADTIMNQPDPNALVIGDSADKKAIDTMKELGVPIIGVDKKGSGGDTFTNAAIKFVQGQRISITKRSLNFIKSYRNFMWQTDKEGVIIPKYDHYWSDGMMAVIYGMTNFNSARREEDVFFEEDIFTKEGFLI
jgi:phage terminase large subunit